MTPLAQYGQKLKILREQAGLTQEVLAAMMPVSEKLISPWEKGRKKPGQPSAMRLVEIFVDRLTLADAWEWVRLAGHEPDVSKLQELFPGQGFQPPPVEMPVPMQHPSLPDNYVARRGLERKILKGLPPQSARKCLVLFGPGGSGKSTLAAWAAESLRSRYSDGIIWVPYSDVLMAQHWIANSFQVHLSGTSLAERAGQLRSLLREKCCLLVLDDVKDSPDLVYLKVHDRNCPLLITTRDKAVAHVFDTPTALNVEGLTAVEGQRLLRSYWAGAGALRVQLEHLAARVENLPLALRLVGAQLQNGYTPIDLYQALEQETVSLTVLDIGPPSDPPRSLSRCFDLSYERLDPAARLCFAQLGVFGGSFTINHAAAIWSIEELNQARRLLQQMLRFMLVIPGRNQGYRLHSLVRDYARYRLRADWPETALSAWERYTAYFVRHFLYHPGVVGSDRDQGPVIDDAWPEIVAAIRWAAGHRPAMAAQAALLAHTERPALVEEVGQPLLAAVVARIEEEDVEPEEKAVLCDLLGDLYLLLDDLAEGLGCFERASRLWAGLGNRLAGSQAKLRAAGIHLLRQDHQAAATAARQAQALLHQSLPLADLDAKQAIRLFYWFNMVYTPLTRWKGLPEAHATSLVNLANQVGQPLLQARALDVHQLWCTTGSVPRRPEIRARGSELAIQAYWLWRESGRQDRADDEVSFARYRLKNRYSRLAAARYARRRSGSTPRIGPAQRDLLKKGGKEMLYWWAGANEEQRVGWLSWMLPRFLGVVDLPRRPSKNKASPLPALRPGSRAYVWVEEILNLGTLGSAGRRLAKHWQPPPDHFLNGPEWRVLSGQRIFPLEAPEARAVVAQYLADLEQKLG